MDGIADMGSVVGRVATCACVRNDSVPGREAVQSTHW
jgi:hypothetical protein